MSDHLIQEIRIESPEGLQFIYGQQVQVKVQQKTWDTSSKQVTLNSVTHYSCHKAGCKMCIKRHHMAD